MPGKMNEVFTFLRDYKIPDGKGANNFAFNGELKNKAFAIHVTQETHDEWHKLAEAKVDGKGISIKNLTLNKTPGFTSNAEAHSQIKL